MIDSFSPLIENAIRLANYWHQDQTCFGEEFEFFIHPTAVATILARAGFSEEVVAAGYCHHLLEYTQCPQDEIYLACGEVVADIVKTVTEDTSLAFERYWEIRKKRYIEAVRIAPFEAKAVCVADRIYCLQTFMVALEEHGMDYFKHFHRGPDEKLWFEDHVCIMLQDTWKHPLVTEYNHLVDNFVHVLEELSEEYPGGKEFSYVPDYTSGTVLYDFDEPQVTQVHKRGSHDKRQHPEVEHIQQKSLVDDTLSLSKDTLFKLESQVKLEMHGNHTGRKIYNQKAQKSTRSDGKYLKEEEFSYVLPAALKLAIHTGFLTNPLLQENLHIPYVTAFKVLKELKRLHIIDRADSFKPRKVDKAKAQEVLDTVFPNNTSLTS